MIKTFEAFNEFDPLGEEQWDEEIEFHNDEELFNFIKIRLRFRILKKIPQQTPSLQL